MKFEPIRYREKTTEFFGKKGISWHGAAIFFYGRHPSSGTNAGSRTEEDVLEDVYAVCCLLDAVLARLRLEFPSVHRVNLLSDNATCYQNDLLPAMAPFIAKHHGLSLKGFIHSETQRGKSLLDAHFALAMMHINRFCNESRKDVTTPGDIVVALNSSGGVANCTGELAHINRENAQMKRWIGAQKSKKLSRLGRINEIAYGDWIGEAAKELDATCFKLSYYRGGLKYRVGLCSVRCISAGCHSGVNDEEFPPQNEEQDEETYIPESNVTNRPHEYTYRSNITGVSVYTRARIRRQRKNTAFPKN